MALSARRKPGSVNQVWRYGYVKGRPARAKRRYRRVVGEVKSGTCAEARLPFLHAAGASP